MENRTTKTGIESREWLEDAVADFEERAAAAELSERERESAARWAKIYEGFLAALDEAELPELYSCYMEKADRWQAESLQLAAERGCLAVQSLARDARERLREPLAVVLYDAEWQTLHLFGEQESVCTSILGRAPQEAGADLGGLAGAYISRVVQNVGLGVAPWDWNGKAPWERQAI